MRIRHHHCSGRWDRSAALLSHDVRVWRNKYDPDIFTATEVGDRSRGRSYNIPGYWRLQAPPGAGRDECLIAFKLNRFRLVRFESHRVTRKIYQRENGKPAAPFYAATAVLQDIRSEQRFVISVMHLPSSVEDNNGWDHGRRLVVYRSCIKGWRRHVNDIGKRYKARTRFYVADWNINFKRAFARAFIQLQFPNLHLLWKKPFPKRGTHAGGRLIDGTLASKGVATPVGPKIGAPAPSSDHIMYFEELAARL